MAGISVSIGRESSEDELAAVTEAFQTDKLTVNVDANMVRASADWQKLPMTIMVFTAQGLAPNILWDLIKYSYKKMTTDKRLLKRKPVIVVKRSTYDVVWADGILRAQSADEVVTFESVEDLIKYDKAKTKTTKKSK